LGLSARQDKTEQTQVSSVEKILLEIWREVLKQDMTPYDNFFALGGHSLLALRMLARMEDRFGRTFSLRDIFTYPTVALLAKKIADESGDSVSKAVKITAQKRQQDQPNYFPLSFAQERLWFLQQLNPNDSRYNMVLPLEIEGDLDIVILEQCINQLIKRHEILRTSFVVDEASVQPQQKVQPELSIHINSEKVASENYQNRKQELIVTAQLQVIDLGRLPLITVQHLQTRKNNQTQHLILALLPHIIFDAWSMQVLQKELFQLYLAASNKQLASLPALDFQYGDYAWWQRNKLDYQKSLSYWLENLADAKAFSFPYERTMEKNETQASGGSIDFRLPEALNKKLYAFCSKQQLTPYVLLLACYQRLLSLYAQEDDIAVAVPIADRASAGLEMQLGLYPTLLVMRAKISAEQSVEEFIKTVAQKSLLAFEHQQAPIEKVLEELRKTQGKQQAMAERLPGEQFGLVMLSAHQENYPLATLNLLSNLKISVPRYQSSTHKHDLCLYFSERQQGEEKILSAIAEYDRRLFSERGVQELAQHFIALLDNFIEQPEANIKQSHFYLQQDLLAKLNLNGELYEKVLPLTNMQRGLYLNHLLYPDDVLSQQTGFHVHIYAAVDKDLWKQALLVLTKQYAGLRAQIKAANFIASDLAYQVFQKEALLDFAYADLSGKGFEQNSAALDKFIADFIFTPLQNALTRHGLFKVAAQHYVMVLATSHMLFDAVCAREIWQSLRTIYFALQKQQAFTLREDSLFAYLELEQAHFDSSEIKHFWQEQLKDAVYLGTGLHASKALLEKQAAQAKLLSKHVLLEKTQWQAIKQYCRKQGITPQLYFKGLYGLMLTLYSSETANLCINEFQSVRAAEFQHTFANAFSIVPYVYKKQSLFEQSSFCVLLQDLVATQKQSKNKYFISESLFGKLINREQAGFYYNYLSFDNSEDYFEIEGDGEHKARAQLKTWRSDLKVGVSFEPKLDGDNFSLNLYYHEGLFVEQDFLKSIHYLSEQILAGEDNMLKLNYQPNWRHAAVSIGEKLPDPELSPLQLFEQQVQKQTDAIALKMHGETLTYAQLNQLANQVANYLQAQSSVIENINSNKPVFIALKLPKSFEALAAVLGVWKLGAAFVPVDTLLPELRQQKIIQQSASCFVLDGNAQSWQDIYKQNTSFISPVVKNHLQKPAYIIYTSGTTGDPKGVLVNHVALSTRFYGWLNAYALSEQDKHLQLANIGFDVFIGDVLRALCAGGSLILLAREQSMDIEKIKFWLEQEKITFAEFVPAVLRELALSLKNENKKLHVKRVIVGSDMWFPEDQLLIEQVLSEGSRIINSYGVTETVVDACYLETQISEHLQHNAQRSAMMPGNVGKPYANLRLYILDAEQRLLPKGVAGDLYIAGKELAEGYWKDGKIITEGFYTDPFFLSAEKPERMYRSGDLAKINLQGEVILLGRLDHQINIRGHRIELAEIENQLKTLPDIEDAVVLLSKNHADRLIGYLQVKKFQQLNKTELDTGLDKKFLRAYLAKSLPSYMLPHSFVLLDEFPLNDNGKIDRKALPEVNESDEKDFVAAQGKVEQQLAQIWQELLQAEQVGRFDNFFELGGHSLLLTRLISCIEKTFAVFLPLKLLFENSILNEMALLIETASVSAEDGELEDVDV
jgi:amino acid adenylation domain-containing protein